MSDKRMPKVIRSKLKREVRKLDEALAEARTMDRDQLESSYASLTRAVDAAFDQRDESNELLKAVFDAFSPFELESVLARLRK